MTREEHIYQLKQYLQGKSISMCPASSLYWQEHWEEVIKVLEQEPILDNIRAEIWDLQYGEEEKSMTDENRADAYNNAIKQAIEIIDKYKAESEPQESEDKE